jgi:hypothetical protein
MILLPLTITTDAIHTLSNTWLRSSIHSVSLDRNCDWGAAQACKALLKVLIGPYSRRMLVQLCKFINEAHYFALVNGWLAIDPLSFSECVLYIVETRGWAVYFRNLIRKSQVLFVLVNFSLQGAVFIKFLNKIFKSLHYYIINWLVFVWRSLLSFELGIFNKAVSIFRTKIMQKEVITKRKESTY